MLEMKYFGFIMLRVSYFKKGQQRGFKNNVYLAPGMKKNEIQFDEERHFFHTKLTRFSTIFLEILNQRDAYDGKDENDIYHVSNFCLIELTLSTAYGNLS